MVAEVPVAEVKVKFCRVVEPLARMLVKVPKPVRMSPKIEELARRLVVEARFEMCKLVEVAFEARKVGMVEEEAVKVCKVEEPFTRRLVRVEKPEVREPIVPMFVRKLVVEAKPDT